MSSYIKLMRPHHYIKNILIFGALVCSGQLFDPVKFKAAAAGFAAFCAVSSVVYIINDIQDKEKDRLHPVKQARPVASGKVSEKSAWVFAAFLLLLTLVFNFFIYHPISTCLLALYLILNIFYSFGMKNVPLLDVAILVSGFLIRMIYGAVITEIPVSNWLYLTVITLAFYFSLGKRRNESRRSPNRKAMTREVLQCYSIDFLDKNMYMCLALANTFYALWCMDSETVSHYGLNLTFTVPIILLITMKYSMDIEGGGTDGDPVEVLLHDRILCFLCLFYAFTMFFLLYL